jgi:hypothetical protein
MGIRLLFAGAWMVTTLATTASGQTAQAGPGTALHQRQCVATGEIAAGDLKRVTLTWKQPFANADYAVVGSVADASTSAAALQLSHILIPHTPTTASAIVINNSPGQARSGLLCLDAWAE